ALLVNDMRRVPTFAAWTLRFHILARANTEWAVQAVRETEPVWKRLADDANASSAHALRFLAVLSTVPPSVLAPSELQQIILSLH
ncbi:hypothetical protein Q6312_28595, partial [Klebsiella pneumoniae]|uniref:hypothetical protein n=1 Tax=Klebsiella pneumoniae TaxID=573 RepID=UPI00272F78EC